MEDRLEFNQIIEMLSNLAATKQAKKQIAQLEPMNNELQVKTALNDTTEARMMLDRMGPPPVTTMEGIEEYLTIACHGGCLTAEQLESVAMILSTVSRLKSYLNRCKNLELSLPYYEENLDAMEELKNRIHEMIRAGRVENHATKNLKNIREKIVRLEEKVREKAENVIRTNKSIMADQFYVTRNGRICVPVKKEYKARIKGSVIDQSATGATIYIEPESVVKINEDLMLAQIEEENEVQQILYTLTDEFAAGEETFSQNMRTIVKLDYCFAKGRLSQKLDAVEPEIFSKHGIRILRGRHPLMNKESCVPLDFSLGMQEKDNVRGIIITGPNTGGKTVCIKTVGLICMMAQCGLHVCAKDAAVGMNSQVLCDIGDGQNISQNLSTFSAHITNVLDILSRVNKDSLVILDELGSGTDPTEGMGIAIAVLEEIRKSGALFLVTTHYPEVKEYATKAEHVINARMLFDRNSLKPLYQLRIGEAGESCALYIAQRLGMPGSMLKVAEEAAYHGDSKMHYDERETLKKKASRHLERNYSHQQKGSQVPEFHRGDSVMVLPEKKTGIVCSPADDYGNVKVQMPYGKIVTNHKRLKLQVAASQLYPDDYDFSIIFDTVEERKLRHQMARKYVEGIALSTEDNE